MDKITTVSKIDWYLITDSNSPYSFSLLVRPEKHFFACLTDFITSYQKKYRDRIVRNLC